MLTSRRLVRLALVSALVAPTSLGVIAGPAAAATFTVDSTVDAVDAALGDGVCATVANECTLRAAIQEANQLGGSHTIVLPAGTYTLDIVGPGEDAAATGDLDVTADITIEGAGAVSTIVEAGFGSDAGEVDRVFDVQAGGSLTIEGVTVRNGEVRGADGGGIRSVGTLVVLDSTVADNAALGPVNGVVGTNGNGGGIHGGGVSVTVRNSVIEDNEAADDGGGVTAAGNAGLTLADSVVRGNTAGDKGGGVEVNNNDPAVATITGSWLVGNQADDGGGISFRSDTQGTISNTTISGNTAGADGGAIEANSRVILAVVNSTLSGNSGEMGGAIESEGDTQLSLTNVTIVDNTTTGPSSAAIMNEGTVTLVNSIVADNPGAPDCRAENGATFVSGGHNLDSDGTCGLNAEGDLPASDPMLGTLADNGGFAPTHLPQAGSPVIDAGDDIACPAADQRGVVRPQDGDGDGTARCDIGAVEVLGAVVEDEDEDEAEEDVADEVVEESPAASPVTAVPTFTG